MTRNEKTRERLRGAGFFALVVFGSAFVNCLGSALAGEISVPLYLDSLLTMAATALTGLWGGILCAVLSNATLFLFDYTMLPFTLCHALTAVLAHITFRHYLCGNGAGAGGSLQGVASGATQGVRSLRIPVQTFLWAGLWSALSNALLGNIIAERLFSSIAAPKVDNMVQGVYIATESLFFATYLTGILTNLADKMISAVLSFGAYWLVRRVRR